MAAVKKNGKAFQFASEALREEYDKWKKEDPNKGKAPLEFLTEKIGQRRAGRA